MTSALLEGTAPNAMTAPGRSPWRSPDPALSSWERGGSGLATRSALIDGAREKLNRLAKLRSGWDGHRGLPTDLLPVMVLNGVLGSLIRDDQPTPQVAPTPDGGVQVAWLVNGDSLEVEVSPGGEVVVLAFDEGAGTYVVDSEFEYHSPDLAVIQAAREELDGMRTSVTVREGSA